MHSIRLYAAVAGVMPLQSVQRARVQPVAHACRDLCWLLGVYESPQCYLVPVGAMCLFVVVGGVGVSSMHVCLGSGSGLYFLRGVWVRVLGWDVGPSAQGRGPLCGVRRRQNQFCALSCGSVCGMFGSGRAGRRLMLRRNVIKARYATRQGLLLRILCFVR